VFSFDCCKPSLRPSCYQITDIQDDGTSRKRKRIDEYDVLNDDDIVKLVEEAPEVRNFFCRKGLVIDRGLRSCTSSGYCNIVTQVEELNPAQLKQLTLKFEKVSIRSWPR